MSTVFSEAETIKAIEMTKNILSKYIKECSELLTTEGFSTDIQVKIIQDSFNILVNPDNMPIPGVTTKSRRDNSRTQRSMKKNN